MPRRKVVEKRPVQPDSKYKDKYVTRFIHGIMSDGKKSVAERILYNSFSIIEERTKEDPLAIFRRAISNVRPTVEVKSRRVGGSTYQVPVEVPGDRRDALAIRWLISFSQNRNERTMQEKLAAELLDAANNRGASVKRREDTHRMAEANKAFAHYRW